MPRVPSPSPRRSPFPVAIVLAAGKGTRMNSSLPKVLQPLRGKPILDHVLAAARAAGISRILVVVGHRPEMVRAHLVGSPGVETIIQEPQLGTGHAVAVCLGALEGVEGPVLVLSGDVPCLGPGTLRLLLDRHAPGTAMTLLTAVLQDARGYGRILRDSVGKVVGIREQKDLKTGEEGIREANMGVYAFDPRFLLEEIPRLGRVNAQGEYYLPDLLAAAASRALPAAACLLEDPREALGINNLKELARMEETLRRKKIDILMDAGVRVVDPASAFVDESVEVAADAVLHPQVHLRGETRVESGAVIQPGCVITDSIIGPGAEIRPFSVIAGSVVEKDAVVGPFAHLRPGTRLQEGAKVGNFVEVKKSVLGKGSKASHLTYLGDSTLGECVNVGAGTVTCNYDGFSKHRTAIEDGVFIGSGAMLVAPVTVGKGSVVAAGSTITRDVPPDALAVGRARQENKEGWAKRRRERLRKKGG